MASTSNWMPKRYSISEDFELWINRFESYCRAAKVTEGLKCDVLLAARVAQRLELEVKYDSEQHLRGD